LQGALTEDAIRRLYQPPGAFRISRNKYPAGTRFHGTTRAGRLFVLTGSCELLLPERVELSAGQFFDFPAGNYGLAVLGQEDLDIVKVWQLPPEFQTHDRH
jgi:hypothetical protein